MTTGRQDHTGSVVISGPVTITGNVIISGPVQVWGAVTVSGAVTITAGHIIVDAGTINVGTISQILAGTITFTNTNINVGVVGSISGGIINVQTSAGVEISIGKKDYTPVSRVVSNDGGTMLQGIGALLFGKLFPCGMRGYIYSILVWYNNIGGAASVTIHFATKPGGAAQYSQVVTFTGGTSGWIEIAISQFWDFDSMFVWFDTGVNIDFYYGYDVVTQYTNEDLYLKGLGAWYSQAQRLWLRVNIQGQVHYPIPVEGTVSIKDIDGGSVTIDGSLGTTPATYNVTMTAANTEYHQALPVNVRKFTAMTRDRSAWRGAWETGKVGPSTAPWFDVLKGETYYEDGIKGAALTLYFASSSAGKILTIIAWT